MNPRRLELAEMHETMGATGYRVGIVGSVPGHLKAPGEVRVGFLQGDPRGDRVVWEDVGVWRKVPFVGGEAGPIRLGQAEGVDEGEEPVCQLVHR